MDEFGSLIEPPPVPFRFGAPGWYVLAILTMLLLATATILLMRYHRRNRYRRQALHWLQLREEELLHNGSIPLLVYETNMLLKRIAMRRYGRRQVAPLRGAQWLSLLNQTTKRPLFDNKDETLLAQFIYYPTPPIHPDDAAGFTAKSKTWIQHHRYHHAL